jgi:protein tyrosine/serine phosphatase
MITDRVLQLEGVHNFRDYGGYPVSGGGRLKTAYLWRSGQHHGATKADLGRISELGLATVFDLRSSVERTTHPCRRPDGFTAVIHHAEDENIFKAVHNAPHIQAAAATPRQRDAASARDGMRRNYGHIAFRPGLMAMMRKMLAELAAGRGPSLVNCMAGKDRTGIAVAVVQLAVGVHRDDVIADYLLTNTAGDIEARIAAGARTIRDITGQADESVMRVLMGVEADYLESAFDMIAERHGSIDSYLADALGADDALRDRLREALVV